MWGAIVAKKKPSKDGKFRPYLKWVAIPLALSQLLCFFNIGVFFLADRKAADHIAKRRSDRTDKCGSSAAAGSGFG